MKSNIVVSIRADGPLCGDEDDDCDFVSFLGRQDCGVCLAFDTELESTIKDGRGATKRCDACLLTSSSVSQLIDAALQWWQMRTPCGWTTNDHVKNPTVNCTTRHDSALARRVADYVEEVL